MRTRKRADRHAERAYARWWHKSHKWRGWTATVAGAALMVAGIQQTRAVSQGCGDLYLAVRMAGTPQQLAWLIDQCYAQHAALPEFSAWHLLRADLALIGGYTMVCTMLIIAGWWRFEAAVLRRCWWVILLPAATAGANLVEDALLYVAVTTGGDGRLTYGRPFVAQWLLITASWVKWVLLFAAAFVLAMSLAVLLVRFSTIFPPARAGETGRSRPAGRTRDPGRRGDLRRAVETPPATERERRRRDPELAGRPKGPPSPGTAGAGVVGVCLSGGGIRATSFALGVLQALDDAPTTATASVMPSPLRSARYLAAVSGGSWAACAWTLQKIDQQDTNAAQTVVTALQADTTAGYQRQKYLMNGRGGVLGPLWWVLLCAFVNLSGIAAIVYLVAWPLGYFQTTCAVSATTLGPSPHCGSGAPVPDANQIRFLAPAVVLAGAGLLALIVCGFNYRRWARKWPLGIALALSAAFTLLYLIGLPWVFDQLASGTLKAAILSAISASGVIAVAGGTWKVLGGPLIKHVSGRLGRVVPKMLGVVLFLGVIAWALVVMYFAAQEKWGPAWLILPTTWLLLTLVFFSPNWPTLHDIYSHRLRRSFDPSAGRPFSVTSTSEGLPTGGSGGVTWAELARHTRSESRPDATVPELILCCAQQRHGLAPGGLRADTFTISPHWVRQGHRSVPTVKYLDRAKTVKWRAKLNRVDVDHVSAWLATSGAAVASAMGRSSLGSTNALMAAINADLGVWLPNVRLVQSHPEYRFRRPTFGHLGKEIFGLYGAHDRYVFITDGGHWDNLGLVELLRRRCDEIYCVDSSADPPFSFNALRQSLGLASLELDECHDLDVDFTEILRDLKPRDGEDALPRTNVTTFDIHVSDRVPSPTRDGAGRTRRRVTIHYLKLQASQDMGVDLRRYAIADPKFPRYSTAQQLLSPQQFVNLVEAGKDAGTKMMAQRAATMAATAR